MKNDLDTTNETLTFTVNGDLVSSTANLLRPQVLALLETSDASARWRLFRLDLTAAKMVDSVGLNFIVTILKAVQKRDAKMQVVCQNQNVHRTLLFTRLDKHVELIKA
jgi:anti-anti-sigma factor